MGGLAARGRTPPPPDPAPPPAGTADWLWPSPFVAWYAVGMIALATAFGQLDRGVMSLLVEPIKRDTHMTDLQISLLMGSAYSLTYLCAGLPVARLADAGRRTVVLCASLATWSVGTIFCGFSTGFWQFFAGRGIIGIGEAGKAPICISLIPDFVRRQWLVLALGIFSIAIVGGDALATLLGGLLMQALETRSWTLPVFGELQGWRLVFAILGLPGLFLAAIFAFTVREPVRHGVGARSPASLAELARFMFQSPASRVLIPLLMAGALNSINILGAISWRPTFFERTYGISIGQYGILMGVGSLVTAPIGVLIGAPLAAWATRRWDDGHLKVVVLGQICSIPITILAPLAPTAEMSVALQLAANTLLTVMAPASLAAIQIITPNAMRGQVNATSMAMVGVLGQGLGPTVIALLTDFLFRTEADLRFALVSVAAFIGPLVLSCHLLALRPFGHLYRTLREAEERAGRSP